MVTNAHRARNPGMGLNGIETLIHHYSTTFMVVFYCPFVNHALHTWLFTFNRVAITGMFNIFVTCKNLSSGKVLHLQKVINSEYVMLEENQDLLVNEIKNIDLEQS